MYTVKVGLTDDKMFFINQPPKLWNGNQERVRLDFEPEGTFAGAADACALSVRFADGSEVDAPYGKCFVPQDKFYATGLTFQAVAYSGQVAAEGEVFHTGSVQYISKKAMVGTEFGPAAQLVEGEEYILTIGDIERRGTAAVIVEDDMTTYCVGNPSLYGMETDNGLDYLVTTFEMSGTIIGGIMLNLDRQDLDGATVTVSTAGTPGETVSDALTVELRPDEDGLYTFVEGGDTVLLESQCTYSNGGLGMEFLANGLLEVGKEYVLKVGDIERRGVAFACDDFAPGAVVVGNPSAGTFEPVGDIDYMVVTGNFDGTMVGFMSVNIDRPDLDGATFTVSEAADLTYTKRLPEKVIPSVGGSGCECPSFVTFMYDLDNAEYTGCSHTFDQALDILANGTPALFLVQKTTSGGVDTAFGTSVIAHDENNETMDFTSETVAKLRFTFSDYESLEWYSDGTLLVVSGK